jgi:peptidoglycan-associated lipoprotein
MRNPLEGNRSMMKHTARVLFLGLLAMCLAIAAPGCPKKKAPPATPEPVATPAPAPTPAPTPKPVEVKDPGFQEPKPAPPIELSADEIKARGLLQTVYFDLDKHDLSDATRATLRTNADWLKANSRWKVVVEGHCDERGTTEYNLELGGRRSRAVRDFLVSLGVAESRIRTVSYGEERAAAPGHDESAWSRNRRAEFAVE